MEILRETKEFEKFKQLELFEEEKEKEDDWEEDYDQDEEDFFWDFE
jgi:hypothetical protein